MNAADRHLAVPGARLRYRDEGAGPAVVLVHGWTLDLDVWQPQAALAASQRVVRYDRRGFGLSTGKPSLMDDVVDLHTLLGTLGIDHPLLVGTSQGARVVLEFAARHPGAARGLVLDGAPPLADADLPMTLFRELAARSGMAAFRAAWRAHPLTQLLTADPRLHELLAEILARYPGHDLLAPPADPHPGIGEAPLGRIRTPSLVVNGARDLDSRQRAGLRLQALLPDAEHVFVQEAAHLPNLDAPQRYNQILAEFARRHVPAAA
ncbi:MAG: alpha/beta hydrolase [Pseudomonadota bacterium]